MSKFSRKLLQVTGVEYVEPLQKVQMLETTGITEKVLKAWKAGGNLSIASITSSKATHTYIQHSLK